MFELIRDILKIWILRRTPKIELRRAKLETLAREFSNQAQGILPEERIHDAFRLARIWLGELDGEGQT
jgi:hypothetical protein